jgi:phosphopantetheinyl transferase (holo-ACP synthase)
MPCVSIAHTEEVAVALACRNGGARVGIDVERIKHRSFLDGVDPVVRPEWITRLWCAREAVAKATGMGMIAGPRSVEVISIDRESGGVIAQLGPELAAACPALSGLKLKVGSSTRDGYAWAWIVHEGGEQ